MDNHILNADANVDVIDFKDMLLRYREVRSVSMVLQSELAKRLARGTLEQGGKNLGLFRGGKFITETNDQTVILMDHCIYDLHYGGRNAVDQYLIDSPPLAGSPEMACLLAMQRAWYSIFYIEIQHRGFGLTVRDIISDNMFFLADENFSVTGIPGGVMAMRLVPRRGFVMTTGAGIPMGITSKENLPAMKEILLKGLKFDSEGKFSPAPLIREFLARGMHDAIKYQPPGDAPPTRAIGGTPKIGRNDPCLCGSGKKFKQCCLNRD